VRVYAGKRNFEITGVKIMAFNANGEQVVDANAIPKDGWIFRIPDGLSIQQIAVLAHDFPGNVVKEVLRIEAG
jgi:hypothetical protein